MEMLKAGVHFGHKTSLWNPKMASFIFTTRNNLHIFDLEKTKQRLEQALSFAQDVAVRGGSVLFIGTKRQAKEEVKKAAENCNMPYVVTRWLGGTFTNFKTIQKTVKKMEKYEKMIADGEISKYTKKEQLMIRREVEKMKTFFSGIKDMKKLPDAVLVFDVKYDDIPVKEANQSKVKVIGLVDTNSNPDGVDFVIPSNDDAVKVIAFMASKFALAINEARESAKSPLVATPQAVIAE